MKYSKLRSRHRPQWVRLSFVDPFDGRLLWSVTLPYSKRASANGAFTGHLRSIPDTKRLCSKILEGRTPKMRVNLFPPFSS